VRPIEPLIGAANAGAVAMPSATAAAKTRDLKFMVSALSITQYIDGFNGRSDHWYAWTMPSPEFREKKGYAGESPNKL
jgi:hypothetical protein